MKKLDVTKILVLGGIAIGLMACGPTQTGSNPIQSDTNELNVTKGDGGMGAQADKPLADGGMGAQADKPLADGGMGAQADKPLEDGGMGGQADKEQPLEDGGMGAQADKPLEDGGMGEPAAKEQVLQDGGMGAQADKPLEDGGMGAAATKASTLTDGGMGLSAYIVDRVLVIQGTVSDDGINTIFVVINGKEQYQIPVRNLSFSTKMELSDEDFTQMNVQVVIGKEVHNFMLTAKGLQELKF
jgi:hypothetical protein